jgi:hypothetical protein
MFMALGRPVMYTLTFALLAGTNTIGSLLAVGGGVEAVAWAVAVGYGVTGVANFTILRRYVGVGVSDIVRPLTPVAVACVGMAAVIVGFNLVLPGHLHDAAVLALQCVGGAVVYAAVLSLVSRSLWMDLLETVGSLRGKQGDPSAIREHTT